MCKCPVERLYMRVCASGHEEEDVGDVKRLTVVMVTRTVSSSFIPFLAPGALYRSLSLVSPVDALTSPLCLPSRYNCFT